jgi:hypothetical protein
MGLELSELSIFHISKFFNLVDFPKDLSKTWNPSDFWWDMYEL